MSSTDHRRTTKTTKTTTISLILAARASRFLNRCTTNYQLKGYNVRASIGAPSISPRAHEESFLLHQGPVARWIIRRRSTEPEIPGSSLAGSTFLFFTSEDMGRRGTTVITSELRSMLRQSRRQHLVRVQYTARVEHLLDPPHRLDRRLVLAVRQLTRFHGADAVLRAYTPALLRGPLVHEGLEDRLQRRVISIRGGHVQVQVTVPEVPVPEHRHLRGVERRGCRRGYRRCLLYTSPSPRDKRQSRMPSSA